MLMNFFFAAMIEASICFYEKLGARRIRRQINGFHQYDLLVVVVLIPFKNNIAFIAFRVDQHLNGFIFSGCFEFDVYKHLGCVGYHLSVNRRNEADCHIIVFIFIAAGSQDECRCSKAEKQGLKKFHTENIFLGE